MYYYKFNIADWNLSTAHLSPEEEAIYFRLVNHYYNTEKPIPLETQTVIRRLRLDNYSETVAFVLSEFFEETKFGWFHSRCSDEIKKYKTNSKKNKKNGALGGRPRTTVSTKKPSGLANGNPNESQNNPNQEPLTKNQEPLTKGIGGNFVPPDTHLVAAYCSERGNQVDAEKFVDFYQTKGWMVGKNKMKDWKAAVRTWEKSEDEKNKRNGDKQSRSDAIKRETFHGNF